MWVERYTSASRPSFILHWIGVAGQTHDFAMHTEAANVSRRLALSREQNNWSDINCIDINNKRKRIAWHSESTPIVTFNVSWVDTYARLAGNSWTAFEFFIIALYAHLDSVPVVPPIDCTTAVIVYSLLEYFQCPESIGAEIRHAVLFGRVLRGEDAAALAAASTLMMCNESLVCAIQCVSRFLTNSMLQQPTDARVIHLCTIGVPEQLELSNANGRSDSISNSTSSLDLTIISDRDAVVPLQSYMFDMVQSFCGSIDGCECVHRTEAALFVDNSCQLYTRYTFEAAFARDGYFVEDILNGQCIVEALTLRHQSTCIVMRASILENHRGRLLKIKVDFTSDTVNWYPARTNIVPVFEISGAVLAQTDDNAMNRYFSIGRDMRRNRWNMHASEFDGDSLPDLFPNTLTMERQRPHLHRLKYEVDINLDQLEMSNERTLLLNLHLQFCGPKAPCV